jgi:hypothetical protein
MLFIIYLETVKVNEGKRFVAFCASLPTPSILTILSAIYQVKKNPRIYSKDVTKVVRKLCALEEFCSFPATSDILTNDLCFTCAKELEVTYTCSNQQSELQFDLEKSMRRIFSFPLDIFGPVLSSADSFGDYIVMGKFSYVRNSYNKFLLQIIKYILQMWHLSKYVVNIV